MMILPFIVMIAYMIGSVPTSVWVGRAFYGIDIRKHGSGNAGATNTFRVLGRKPGIFVFIVDIFKGYIAVQLFRFMPVHELNINQVVNLHIILGVAALIGHIFPLWAGFKGGKGVATLFGLVLALHPLSALLCILVFTLVFAATQYVSLGSIAAGMCYPFQFVFVFRHESISLEFFAITMSVLLIITHRKNIRRLVKKQESKFRIKKNEPKTI